MSFPVDEARSRRRCHRNLAKAIGSPAQLAPMSAFPFDLVVFDLDGTLVDTGPDLTAALNHVLHRMGRQPVTEADVRDMFGLGAAKMPERGLDATGGGAQEGVQAGLEAVPNWFGQNKCDRGRPQCGRERSVYTPT